MLITVLRQLRAGYPNRPRAFPQSVIVCGVRDVRDYRIQSGAGQAIITGGSAFNIKAESLRLGDFTEREVTALLTQHTAETSQPFMPDALAAVWELTAGQPWLVNALAYETCFKMPEGRDRAQPITAEMVYTAKENLILRRETHLDQLTDKLKEERVRRVIAPMLQGIELGCAVSEDDLRYVTDLGLIRRTLRGGGGAPGDLRPPAGADVGGADLPPRGGLSRDNRAARGVPGDGLGDVRESR